MTASASPVALKKSDFPGLIAKARAAGAAAADAASPHMIRVRDEATGRVYDPFPICGFGWVHFKGNTSFGRWAKKNVREVGTAYPSGLWFWVGYGGQSYDAKMAYARAFAAVLKEAGIDAWASGRLD